MRYLMSDGAYIVGRSYDDIVQKMSRLKLTEPQSLQSYMTATASRCQMMYGITVDATNPKTFIESMVAGQLMERVA